MAQKQSATDKLDEWHAVRADPELHKRAVKLVADLNMVDAKYAEYSQSRPYDVEGRRAILLRGANIALAFGDHPDAVKSLAIAMEAGDFRTAARDLACQPEWRATVYLAGAKARPICRPLSRPSR